LKWGWWRVLFRLNIVCQSRQIKNYLKYCLWQSVTMFPVDLLTRSFLPILTAYLSRAVWIVCTVPPSVYISPHYVHTSSPSSLCLVFYRNTTIPLEYEQCHHTVSMNLVSLSLLCWIPSWVQSLVPWLS
jgi:hypothetical protein